MQVLFTCVGKSDPLTIFENCEVYDAGYLHIARNYKPSKIYFYMSKEICELDKKDNRYKKSIDLLNEFLGTDIIVEKIKRPDLVDVQRFDEFYDDFESYFQKIVDENGKDVEILCNVSSGTPAMKSTLQILAALSKYKLIPIQVDDPSKGKYDRNANLENISAYWKENQDNIIVSNRTYLSNSDKFNFKIQKELLINLINSYDYEAAYNLACDYKYRIGDELLKLLKFALDRVNLDTKEILKSDSFNLLSYENLKEAELFEYGLWMKIKKAKGDYLDFIRGVTPFMYGACERALKNICDIDIYDYCESNDKNVNHLTRNKLKKDEQGEEILTILDRHYRRNQYQDKFISEQQMLIILNVKLDSDSKLKSAFESLDTLRIEKRNIVSHQISCVREEDVIKDLGRNMNYYVNTIKKVLACLGYDVRSYWNSYEQMNSLIIEEIEKTR